MFFLCFVWSTNSISQESNTPQDILERLKNRFSEADRYMEDVGILEKPLDLRGLPQGEQLIFEIIIPPRLQVEGVIFGEIGQNTILLSLKDFINTLSFPISYSEEDQTFSGWFLKESNQFIFNNNTGIVSSNGIEYRITKETKNEGDDFLVPIEDLKQWFNTDIDIDIGTQQLNLLPTDPFPATQKYERRNRNISRRRSEPPKLPRYNQEDYDWLSVPVVDVSTRSRFTDRAVGDQEIDNFVNIRTAGEFAKGALLTNSSFNDEDILFSARVTYLQESSDADLLGDLKARRFEIGDLTPTRLPITGGAGPETGIRITNSDSLVNLTLPSTRIEGYYFPEWDIELYRNNSLVSFQETDGEGYYVFENVPLLSDRNFFKIVAYGPQGEVREEIINIPYDRNRLAESGAVYDISLSFQDRQFYERNPSEDQDRDTPHVVGFYEIPIFERSSLRAGARYRQEDGEDKFYSSIGLSTSFQEALINAEIASDEDGELKSEFSILRQFGEHRVRADLDLATDGFTPDGRSSGVNIFSNRYIIEGPLGIPFGQAPRYSANFRYDVNSNDDKTTSGFFVVNTQFQNFGLNQSINYNNSDVSITGTEFGGSTALTGSYGRSLFRGLAGYDFSPDLELEQLTAFWKYRYNYKLDSQLQIDHSFDDINDLTRYSAQLNWKLDEALITPRISYDSDNNFEAVLNTRFSLAKAPNSNDIIMTRDSLTNFGTLSALVFLDKDGNFQFDGDDEPIPDARILTPQNSGGDFTNEDGIAYLSRFRPGLVTDIYLDNGSLTDPFWISAKEGHSISPKTGNNIYMEFPVHMTGEIDGIVYNRFLNGQLDYAANTSLALYNELGELEQRTITGPDGFYIFSQIPPGTYYLAINDSSIKKGFGRPLPEIIDIGYDGTIIYGKNIYLSEGQFDVPVNIKSINTESEIGEQKIALNLGSYNSKLMSTYIWRKLVKNFSYYLGGSERVNNEDEGSYDLIVTIPETSISSGYDRCSGLVRAGEFCEVNVYLAGK